jgi:hypothetical protein
VAWLGPGDRGPVADVRTFLTRLRNTCLCCLHGVDRRRPMEDRRCCAVGRCCERIPSTRLVQQVHSVLRNALQAAVREELIGRNVVKLVQVSAPSYEVNRGVGVAEARKLRAVAEHDRFYALHVLALYLGLRSGELLGLRWEDLDLDGECSKSVGACNASEVGCSRSRRRPGPHGGPCRWSASAWRHFVIMRSGRPGTGSWRGRSGWRRATSSPATSEPRRAGQPAP